MLSLTPVPRFLWIDFLLLFGSSSPAAALTHSKSQDGNGRERGRRTSAQQTLTPHSHTDAEQDWQQYCCEEQLSQLLLMTRSQKEETASYPDIEQPADMESEIWFVHGNACKHSVREDEPRDRNE